VEVPNADVADRFRVTTISLIELLCERAPLVLCLEDLQWMDPSSVGLLSALTEQCGSLKLRLLLTVCWRDDEIAANEPAREWLQGLSRRSSMRTTRVPVPTLSSEDIARLYVESTGASPDDPATVRVVDELMQRTGGVPFALHQTLLGLRHRGHDSDAAAVDHAELMRQRLVSMPQDAQDILAVAACVGAQFSGGVLAAVSGATAEQLNVALGLAVRAGFVVASQVSWGDEGSAFTFCHDRFQELLLSVRRRRGVAGAGRPGSLTRLRRL
jgi:predicted ATPase